MVLLEDAGDFGAEELDVVFAGVLEFEGLF
jgi:hypothetical protein